MILVLTAGLGLGSYVPARLLERRLAEHGVPCRLDVLEKHFSPAQRERLIASRTAFRRDLRIGIALQRTRLGYAGDLPSDARSALLASWRALRPERIVVFSGFWLPLVRDHLAAVPGTRVDLCHVDSVVAPSFALHLGTVPARSIRLGDAGTSTIPWTVPMCSRAPIKWADRSRNLVVHGGGWGLGGFQDAAAQTSDAGWETQVISTPDDWLPWEHQGLPPITVHATSGVPARITASPTAAVHPAFDLCRGAAGLVTKPGGASLLDSLSSRTPLVLLDPFGPHEAANARLWTTLGAGVTFDVWRASGYDPTILQRCHETLARLADGPKDYAEHLARATTRDVPA